MAKNQKKYTPEFKQQIVDLYKTGNYSYPMLEREYGVARSSISNWVRNAYHRRTDSDTQGLQGSPERLSKA